MNQEHLFLASAYLDGELDAAERAIAEADPAVMAEVEQLRALHDELQAVEPPSAAARESAISAAMTEFRTAHAPSAVAPDADARPTVVPFFRRPIARSLLGAAAAVVAIGLLGVIIARTGAGDDDTADEPALDLTEEPADEPADEPAEEPAEEAAAAAADDEPGDVAQSEEVVEEMIASDAAAEEPAGEAADEPAEEPAAEPADEPADGGFEPFPPEIAREVAAGIEDGDPFSTDAELAAYATYLLEQEAEGTLAPTPNHDCPFDRVLGSAVYQVDDLAIDVLVVVDPELGFTTAVDAGDCFALLEAPLP